MYRNGAIHSIMWAYDDSPFTTSYAIDTICIHLPLSCMDTKMSLKKKLNTLVSILEDTGTYLTCIVLIGPSN